MAKKETPEEQSYREAVERIAGHIGSLAKAVKSLLGGPLNKRALVILLANSSGESQKSVDAVLKSLSELERDWLNK